MRDDGELALHNGTQSHHLFLRDDAFMHINQGRSTRRVELHNHPSGDPKPSAADIDITNQIVDATAAISVKVHDHLIIAKNGVVSLKNLGLL